MNPLTRFFALNRRLSLAVEARLPQAFRHHLHTLYKYRVAALLNHRPGQVVLDVGGGKECPFLPYLDEPQGHLVIALDCSEEELRQNRQLNTLVVGDAAKHGFPIRDASVDLVVSRSLAEHIRDNAAYFENCARALRPGGTMIHAFPSRFAPFALVNQVLPNRFVRRLISYFHPDWVENGNYGFLAFYDRCYYSAVRKLVRDNRLRNERYVFTYYQSLYFTSFFPLFCVMVSYDLLLWKFGIRNLASGMLVTAERSSASPVPAEATACRSDVLVGSESG
jgi:SAM-dependent methyltransferase